MYYSDFPLVIVPPENVPLHAPVTDSCSGPIDLLDKNVKENIIRRCNSEMQARMNQKKLQVIKRVEACELHKCQLLEEIYNYDKIHLSPFNRGYIASGIGNRGEIVLIDTAAVMGTWPGKVWVTYTQVCFYANVVGFSKKLCCSFRDLKAVSRSATLLGIGDIIRLTFNDRAEEVKFTLALGGDRFVEVVTQVSY